MDTGSLEKHGLSIIFLKSLLIPPMPACTYRGVRYETPARLSKEMVLRYERTPYADRTEDASKEIERTYRGIRY